MESLLYHPIRVYCQQCMYSNLIAIVFFMNSHNLQGVPNHVLYLDTILPRLKLITNSTKSMNLMFPARSSLWYLQLWRFNKQRWSWKYVYKICCIFDIQVTRIQHSKQLYYIFCIGGSNLVVYFWLKYSFVKIITKYEYNPCIVWWFIIIR